MKFRLLVLAIFVGIGSLSSASVIDGMQADLVVGVGALVDRDPNLSGSNSGNKHGIVTLQFGLESKTRIQDFGLRVSSEKISGFGVRADLAIGYERRTKSSSLSVNLNGYMLPAGDVFLGGEDVDLVVGRSDLRMYNGKFSLETGVGRPIGVKLSYGITHRDLQGASSTTRRSISAELKARIGSRTAGRVQSSYERLNTVALGSQRQKAVAIGINHKPTELLEFDAQIGWRCLKLGGRAEEGTEWRTSILRRYKHGSAYAQASVERVQEGSVSSLVLGLTNERHHGASKLEIGVAKISSGSTEPTLLLEGDLKMKRAKVLVAVSRGFVGSDETGETRMGTKFSAKVAHEIGDRGDLQIAAKYVMTDRSASTSARSAGQLAASYHHEIRRNWRWVAGAQRRVRRNSIDGRSGSNSVSFTFERSFSGGL